MNKKNIGKSLNNKLTDWTKHIKDQKVVSAIKRDAIVTGGAFVSLLNGEKPHDYDIYFKTIDSLKLVVEYYIKEWSKTHKYNSITFFEKDGRVLIDVKSVGAVIEEDEQDENSPIEKEKYRPVFISTNAITLSDDVQIVVRFCGSVEQIHENYDFVHTTCSYDFSTGNVELPANALECIINKELVYQGSKYPLASIIRTRKFLERGWTINAGQYLKMALQLNDLDLHDPEVLEDQLVGVDTLYFRDFMDHIFEKRNEDPSFTLDNTYLFDLINKIF